MGGRDGDMVGEVGEVIPVEIRRIQFSKSLDFLTAHLYRVMGGEDAFRDSQVGFL